MITKPGSYVAKDLEHRQESIIAEKELLQVKAFQ